MATKTWVANSQTISQIDTYTVTAVSTGGTISVACNGQTISYVCLVTDTTTTAAAALETLLASASTNAPVFGDATYATSTNTITATAATPGTPFTFTVSSSGGATLTRTATQANVSPNDLTNTANWSGSTLPVNGDTIVFANTGASVLWNLTGLNGVTPAAIYTYMSYTGQIGLPEVNAAGYNEYRPQYLQIPTPILTTGIGAGSGSGFQRYDCQTAALTAQVQAAGGAADDGLYSVRILNVNAASTLVVNNVAAAVAMLPGETSTLSTATCQGAAGRLDVGGSVILTTATNVGAQLNLLPSISLVTANGGQTYLAGPVGYTSLQATNGAQISWGGAGPIGNVNLSGACVVDASVSSQAKSFGLWQMDTGSQLNDPNNTVTFGGFMALVGPVTSGPVIVGASRQVKFI